MSWQNMTIGKKNYTGFGIVLVLLSIMAIISYFGVDGIVSNASKVIDGNKLDGLLAQKEVDHLNWVGKVNALLTDDSITQLDVQIDDHQCAFGKWLYGQDRTQAEQLVPSIAPILKQIEAPHHNLHNSAAKIAKTFSQPHEGLALVLSNRLEEHISWVAKASKSLSTEVSGIGAYQNRLENAVFQAFSILKAINEDTSIGNKKARQKKAMNIIKNMKYGKEGKDYFWLNDLQPKMIMHPYKPQLDGKNLSNSADPNGKKLFIEMVNVCRTNGEGFVTYEWPKYGSDKPVPKLSFVKLYKPWGWIVGTGVYIDTTNKKLHQRIVDFNAGKPFTLDVQTDPEKCVFGRWLAEPKTKKLSKYFPELGDILKDCSVYHNQLHKSGSEIEKEVHLRNYDNAVTISYTKMEDALIGVGKTLKQVIDSEKKLQDGMDKAVAIYASQTVPALKKTQQLLHKIRKEARNNILTDEAMLQSALKTKRTVIFIGLLAIVTGALLAVFISRGIITALQKIANFMNVGAIQVASASEQISTASQSLAEGASEQAASFEETSSSLEEMSAMTRQNSDNSNQADNLMKEANQVVQKANRSMGGLTESMHDISEASQETSKIIKTIDEIAFQTNLLALNAAVEAARAGEAGAGFAVVADEVRNLAMRAADAAKSTSELIEGTVKKISDGSKIVTATNDAFSEVSEATSKVGKLVDEIAAASAEQAEGIEQLNKAIVEADKVTQQNAASTEETASASEEMRLQAQTMKENVKRLLTMVDGRVESTSQTPDRVAEATEKAIEPYNENSQEKSVLNYPKQTTNYQQINPNEIIPLTEDF